MSGTINLVLIIAFGLWEKNEICLEYILLERDLKSTVDIIFLNFNNF